MESSDPDAVRTAAATAFVNGMGSNVRAAVVDFDQSGRVVQSLTSDKAHLVEALQTIDADGEADVGAGVATSIALLSGDTSKRERTVVLFTDGQGAYDERLLGDTRGAGVSVDVVALRPSTFDAVWLRLLAVGSQGTFHVVDDKPGAVVGPAAPARSIPGAVDTDGDGLSDCQETQGSYDARGKRHVTAVNTADTDGDGLTDGQEVPDDLTHLGAESVEGLIMDELGAERMRSVVTDPTVDDTDQDGASDALEFDTGTDPLVQDTDNDGLGDFDELNELGTDPLDANSDGDERDDGWEVDNVEAGFDPIVYDEEIGKRDYASDFARGATCSGLCETDSIAFLLGSLAGGTVGVADVFDLIAAAVKLDVVSAGLALASLAPGAGDTLSFVSKSAHFLERVPSRQALNALAVLMKFDKLPSSLRMSLLEKVDGESVRAMRARGLTDQQILAAVEKRLGLEYLRFALAGAQAVETASELYDQEADAEEYLQAGVPGALNFALSFVPRALGSRRATGSRRPDVYDPQTKTAMEVKVGYVISAEYVRSEIAKDAALKADSDGPVQSVVWHFFPDEDGIVGMADTVRTLLDESHISYVIHLP